MKSFTVEESEKALHLLLEAIRLNNIDGVTALNAMVNYILHIFVECDVPKDKIEAVMQALDEAVKAMGGVTARPCKL